MSHRASMERPWRSFVLIVSTINMIGGHAIGEPD